jgi:glutathione S-transferase
MKLFYFPGACSLAVHIALVEAKWPYELVSITLDKRTSDGRDFMKINPKGFIPALELDNGEVLAEALAILVYIAEQTGALLAEDGPQRWQALEATSFMTTEIHGNFKPFWKNAAQAEKDSARQLLGKHFAVIAAQLGETPYLVGDRLTIADLYLFVMLSWAVKHGIAVPRPLESYFEHMRQVGSIDRALQEEGLA